MSEQMSATIISFPRIKTAPTATSPRPASAAVPGRAQPLQDDPQRRLQSALAALDRAVAEQRTAVAKWRESLSELRSSVQGLGKSLGEYHERMGALAGNVSGLNREARRLEAWADDVLAKEGAAAKSES